MSARGLFSSRWLPLLLAGPQLFVVVVFFYWPTVQALWWSLTLEKPFGGGAAFVGLYNFEEILSDPELVGSLLRSIVFAVATTALSIAAALVLAVAANRRLPGRAALRNMLVWPYAIAAPVVGVTFTYIMHPVVGAFALLNEVVPGLWQPGSDGVDAMIMIVLASAWGLIPVFFLILLSGLQSIPETLHHAAAIDGAGPWRRLRDIELPLLSPYFLFAIVIGLVESFTGGFAIIHTMTQGGPGGATNLLVYKIYTDGFVGLDLSSSSAQSVLLMAMIVALTALNFALFERRLGERR